MEEVFRKGRNVWLLGGQRRSMQQLLRGGSLHLFYVFPAPAMQHTGKKIKCNMNFLDDLCFTLPVLSPFLICSCVLLTKKGKVEQQQTFRMHAHYHSDWLNFDLSSMLQHFTRTRAAMRFSRRHRLHLAYQDA